MSRSPNSPCPWPAASMSDSTRSRSVASGAACAGAFPPPAARPRSRRRCDDASPQGLATISRMLHAAAEVGTSDPHQALWAIWDAAGVAQRWQDEALRDPESVTHGYLDSVLRLFALAEKIADRGGFTARSFAGIVAEQDIAQDSLADT